MGWPSLAAKQCVSDNSSKWDLMSIPRPVADPEYLQWRVYSKPASLQAWSAYPNAKYWGSECWMFFFYCEKARRTASDKLPHALWLADQRLWRRTATFLQNTTQRKDICAVMHGENRIWQMSFPSVWFVFCAGVTSQLQISSLPQLQQYIADFPIWFISLKVYG